ncbi:MAG: aldehyde dehydrogenase family protein [Planctomycetota bacterium]
MAAERIVTSPWDGRELGRVPLDDARVPAAIAAAEEAWAAYRDWPAHRRVGALTAIRDGIAARADAFAATIRDEAGKPITFARGEVQRALRTFTLAAEEASRIGGALVPIDHDPRGDDYTCVTRRRPIGSVVAITPFNFPLNLVAHKLAPALACGNAVLCKPAPQTPLTANLLMEAVADAELPAGLVQCLHLTNDAAQALVTDPRPAALSFTGSDSVGWRLKALAGRKRVQLELGGNAAAVVCDDADLDWAAQRCALGAFAYAGQVCISVQRLFVDAGVYDAFCDRFAAAVDALGVGDPALESTVCGPLIDAAAADRVEAWIAQALGAGATAIRRGTRTGTLCGPTVLTGVPDDQPVACDEVFGPVVVIERCDSFAQAVARADDSRFGLHGAVFTRDIRRAAYAADHWRLGGLVVGDFPLLRIDNMPYGGVKESGLGREGIRSSIEEFTDVQVVLTKVR